MHWGAVEIMTLIAEVITAGGFLIVPDATKETRLVGVGGGALGVLYAIWAASQTHRHHRDSCWCLGRRSVHADDAVPSKPNSTAAACQSARTGGYPRCPTVFGLRPGLPARDPRTLPSLPRHPGFNSRKGAVMAKPHKYAGRSITVASTLPSDKLASLCKEAADQTKLRLDDAQSGRLVFSIRSIFPERNRLMSIAVQLSTDGDKQVMHTDH